MDMNEIKLVTDMLASLGEAGKEAFIWWIVLEKGLGFIEIVLFILAIYLIATNSILNVYRNNLMEAWRDQLQIGSGGCLTAREARELNQRIQKLVDDSIGGK